MAELRVMLPTVAAVLAPSDVCDRVEAPEGAVLLRVAPREVLILGASPSDLTTASDALVDDVSDAWVSLVLEGAEAPEAFARLSELELPTQGWIQGEVAHAAAKVLVEADRITMLVPSMLAAHVEDRIRTDAAEVLSS